MAKLAGHPGAPVDDFAIDDEAAADAGTEREQHHVFASARGAAPILAERPRIGVVLDDDAALQHALQMMPQRKISPRLHVRRRIDDAGAKIEWTRNRYANRQRAPEAVATGHILQREHLRGEVRDGFDSRAFRTRRSTQHQQTSPFLETAPVRMLVPPMSRPTT